MFFDVYSDVWHKTLCCHHGEILHNCVDSVDPPYGLNHSCRTSVSNQGSIRKYPQLGRTVPQAGAPVDCSINQRVCFHTCPSGDVVQKQGSVHVNVCEHNKHTLMRNSVTKFGLKRRGVQSTPQLEQMICYTWMIPKYIIWCYTFSYLAVLLSHCSAECLLPCFSVWYLTAGNCVHLPNYHVIHLLLLLSLSWQFSMMQCTHEAGM